MKTLEILYEEISASNELKEELTAAAKNNILAEFMKANGCDATPEELIAFIKSKATESCELSDDKLGMVSAGCNSDVSRIINHIFDENELPE